GLHVYGHEGVGCPRCQTPIRRDRFMNRSSYLCPRCQRTPRRPRWRPIRLAPMPGLYDAHARARLVAEPGKRRGRLTFELDLERIVHSAAMRRLSDKTQVIADCADDFVRNRLTHSVEVAQVARELGKSL